MRTFLERTDHNLSGPTIDMEALRRSVVVCVGLITLLHLQYNHEGHMDGHVYQLFIDRMHNIEQELSDTLEVNMAEDTDLPF